MPNELNGESDRAVVIFMVSGVEDALEAAIKEKLIPMSAESEIYNTGSA
jgi:hypothetical protein